MLNITPINNKGSNAHGAAVLDYLRATEYYVGADGLTQSASRWMGKAVEPLGLSIGGAVEDAAMVQLAKGFAPDGTPLAQNAGSSKRRVGIDLTFSAEKSLTLVFVQADGDERDRILAAHRTAVDKAFSFLEGLAETRRGKQGSERMDVSGLVASGHTHFCSRDADPQIHEHVLVYGVCQAADGSWATWDPDNVMRHGRAAGALYRAEMAHQMRALGYGIEKDVERDAFDRPTGDVFFRIAGVTDAFRDQFSKRRQAILAYQKEHGGTMQAATMATRKRKDEPSFAELDQMWSASLSQMRADGIALSNEQLKSHASKVQGQSDADIVKAVHERKAVFNRADLVERIALEHVGIMDADAIVAHADRLTSQLTQSGDLYAIKPEQRQNDRVGEPAARYRETRFAASWMVEMEQQIGQRALARKDDPSVRIAPEHVAKAMQKFEKTSGFSLTAEQQSAVRHVTCESGGTTVLTGMAGTGKTTVSSAYVAAFQAAGREVLGASIGWDAAKKLEAESGIPSVSVAAMLAQIEQGTLRLGPQHVVVLDEAAMAGTRSIHTLQAAVDKAGGKLIIQGDAQQLQPIEAGGAFRLARRAVGDAQLTEIRRQASKQDTATAKEFYQDAAKAFQRLNDAGQVKTFEDRMTALQAMAAAYVESPTPMREKLALVSTHSEGRKLNAIVRDHLKASGELTGEEHTVTAKTGRHVERLPLMAGDRIRFTQRNAGLRVYNGTQGVIQSITKTNGAVLMQVRLESDVPTQDGRTLTVDTSQFQSLMPGYALTVHKSQGQGRKEVYQLANPEMTDKHTALVGFTRMKKSYALYGGTDDLEAFGRRVGVERLKENAIDAGVTSAVRVESSHSWSQRMIDKLQTLGQGLRQRATEAQRVLQRSM